MKSSLFLTTNRASNNMYWEQRGQKTQLLEQPTTGCPVTGIGHNSDSPLLQLKYIIIIRRVPPKYTIRHDGMKVSKVNRLQILSG